MPFCVAGIGQQMTSGVEVSRMAGDHGPLLGLRMGCRGKCENCGQQPQALPTKPVGHRIIHVVAPCSPSDQATAVLGAAGRLRWVRRGFIDKE